MKNGFYTFFKKTEGGERGWYAISEEHNLPTSISNYLSWVEGNKNYQCIFFTRPEEFKCRTNVDLREVSVIDLEGI